MITGNHLAQLRDAGFEPILFIPVLPVFSEDKGHRPKSHSQFVLIMLGGDVYRIIPVRDGGGHFDLIGDCLVFRKVIGEND